MWRSIVEQVNKLIQQKFSFRGRNRNLPWYPRRGTRIDIARLFNELHFVSGVEVGTRDGTFAKILCENNPELKLTCVDPWQAYSDRTKEEMEDFYIKAVNKLSPFNVTLVRKPSLDGVKDFLDGELDFAWIDGCHLFDDAIRDIIEWSAKVKKGGIICVHDYDPFCGSDVVHAVNAYTLAHDIRPWYVTRELPVTAFWVKD